jgi:hypothetical protein
MSQSGTRSRSSAAAGERYLLGGMDVWLGDFFAAVAGAVSGR